MSHDYDDDYYYYLNFVAVKIVDAAEYVEYARMILYVIDLLNANLINPLFLMNILYSN